MQKIKKHKWALVIVWMQNSLHLNLQNAQPIHKILESATYIIHGCLHAVKCLNRQGNRRCRLHSYASILPAQHTHCIRHVSTEILPSYCTRHLKLSFLSTNTKRHLDSGFSIWPPQTRPYTVFKHTEQRIPLIRSCSTEQKQAPTINTFNYIFISFSTEWNSFQIFTPG